ncbi:Glyoxylase, beta-lactamase superfamily II [Halobacillus dabanensis]|uniref:Glyoxylase, beta-lactamase superfamily II n=1 Tax=Halobacillus dabanensis TaxID=240302 RepID=A0A1I3T7D4_HALDA|nr:MBL fold metallo-hydrolase [Halobacillus dabanensis]SFJ66483.1 Glyoxylase, beta-lactamase superfamily II [Halobacillus dabanensis]
MSFIQLNEQCYYYHSSVNIGYVTKGTDGVLIDSGIDRTSVKKVLKELEERELPLTHLFITHAHADHYGGAGYVQNNHEVHTIAPVYEEAILRNPSLEPLYLFGGNDPLPELQNKFLQGPPVRIDQVVDEGELFFGAIKADTFLLPGHSYHQLAVMGNGILYAADSYFGIETLRKHKIPYVTDVSKTIESLRRLLSMTCDGAVPGHGLFEEDPAGTIKANITYHQELKEWLHKYIRENGVVSHEVIVSSMCDHFDVQHGNLPQWLLYRTAVTAYLIGLKKADLVEDRIADHKWMFQIKNR